MLIVLVSKPGFILSFERLEAYDYARRSVVPRPEREDARSFSSRARVANTRSRIRHLARSKVPVHMSAPEIDPTQAASERLSRRFFVGLSAAATVAATTGTSTGDAPQTLLPDVPENDPAIVVERITLQRSGENVAAYAARPSHSVFPAPSVVVIMHLWGVDASIRSVVRRLAASGFAAIAPDLFAGLGAPDGDGSSDASLFIPFAKRMQRETVHADVVAAAGWLKQQFPGTKIGIIGFCMGGRIVYNELVADPHLFAAAAPFYGAVENTDPKAIAVPVCGSYGARDEGIPADSVRAFFAALTVPHDLRIYDEAGHAFFDEERPSFVPSAAADAWKRTIGFYNTYLRAAGT
jgi:carboxymethylenebutenolidase